jgi:uncharacterized protein YhaN
MKLKRLDLKAFGPFTKKRLDFNSNHPGLHIIFGPNEAGKSSSLRALKALLYGFPQQTPDNFRHSYDQLLVGGCLENSAGEELIFQRRKKRIGDVIDYDGNPLDAGILAPYLLGLEPEIFESLYGLDHETLVQGGEEILAQKGEVGQALFAAGAGISSVRAVIDQLEIEAAELFKPAGQLPRINKAVKKFKQLKKEAKEASLSSKEWENHQKALNSAEDERTRLEIERNDKNSNLHRLERLEQAIPELAALKSWQEKLTVLGKVTPLPPDFSLKHQQVGQAMRDAELQLLNDKERREKLAEKRKTISFNQDLINQADRIDDFHQRLGEYRKGRKDKPVREGQRISAKREAAQLLEQVRPDLTLDQVETLRPILSKKRTVQTLSTQYEGLYQQIEQARKQKKLSEQEINDIKNALSPLLNIKEPQELIQAFKLAQKAGSIDEQLEKNRREIELNHKACGLELNRIGLWTGNFKVLLSLALPASETLQRFENQYRELTNAKKEIEKEHKKNLKELKKVLTEIKKIEYAGDVPSEEELLRARDKREQGWRLIRRQWLDHEDISAEIQSYAPKQALPEAYESRVQEADQISDRLRREADRVANMATLRARADSLEEVSADNDSEIKIGAKGLAELNQAWLDIWRPVGITPRSAQEMQGWLTQIEKLRFKVDDLFKKEQEVDLIKTRRSNLRRALQRELESIGETEIPSGQDLEPILIFTETVLKRSSKKRQDLEKLIARRNSAQRSLQQADQDLNAADDALVKWQAKWRKALAGLALKNEVSPLEAIDLMDTLKSCFDKLREADDFKKRIAGIDRDAADLEAEVKAVLKTVAPDLISLPLDQAILQLRTLLDRAQKNAALFDEHTEDLELLNEKISITARTLKSATKELNDLLRMADCQNPSELVTVMNRFREYQRIREKIFDIETNLAKIGAGASIETLKEQASEMNADEIPGRIASIRADIVKRINPEINRISQTIGEETSKLAAMDGGDKAARIAEKMEQELAGLRRLSERYAQIKLASKLLQITIDRYREEHQDPVLKIASTYFRDLTLGSFTGLRTDMDDKGEPILVGLRPDDARLTVEKMSAGTRDQLYLALRLATLKWRLETSEPMPFIVDDILINFDDDRSTATLAVLSEISKINQVILFTHHGRIVEEAERIKTNGTIQIHRL